ncbi:hypothetical protein [Tessaracoccus lacteus]|uniref:YcxB family protein n=1 Tax=Tessaracoccus lacteus TaxID=3041766 RepID=A0ABY8PZA6_9ACTN|nr:hypothetical protein [Tessaracoccus sp. T21]WGT47845.1 hypothetical protein QH948_03475 [Tessaracoccus sp. T21]
MSASPFPLIEYDLSRVDARSALVAWDRLRPGRRRTDRLWIGLGGIGGAVGGLSGALLADGEPILWWILALMLVPGVAFGVAVVWLMLFVTRRQRADIVIASGAMPVGPQRVWLDLDGAHHDRPGVSHLLSWAALGEPRQVGGHLIVPLAAATPQAPTGAAVAFILPASLGQPTLESAARMLTAGPGALQRAQDVGRHPSPVLHGEVVLADYVAFNRHFLVTPAGRQQQWMLAATGALLGAFAGYVILGQFTGGLVAVILGAVLAAGGIVVLARSQVGTQAEALVRSGTYDVGPGAWWFDDEEVYARIGGSRIGVAWESVTSVELAGRVGIVWFGRSIAIVVPRSAPGADAFLAAVASRVDGLHRGRQR